MRVQNEPTQGRHEGALLLCCVLFTLLLGAGAIGFTLWDRKHFDDSPPSVSLALSPKIAIGERPSFLGSPDAPYTLVMFGDYQCPPCKEAHMQIPQLLEQYRGRLRLTFRNLPLKTHPQARAAALFAEGARLQGKFWEIHDALYEHQERLEPKAIWEIGRACQLDPAKLQIDASGKAKEALERDLLAAKALEIESVPSFILCRPDGSVSRLGSLRQIHAQIEAKR